MDGIMAGRDPAGTRGHRVIFTALGAAVGVLVLLWAASQPPRIERLNDFYREAWPAYAALAHGQLLEFFRLGPAYIGSLILRAPFALLPSAWSGSARAVFVASSLPCVVAMGAFGTWMGAQPRKDGAITVASRLGPLALCVLNPFAIVALLGGHPEEILGAVTSVAAVVLATRGNAAWAGLFAGLAVLNKPWAVVVVPVVLATLPCGRRRALITIAMTVGCVMLPITALRGGGGGALGLQTGMIFNPPQLFWWFGPHSWIASHARWAIVGASCLFAALSWGRRRPGADPMPDALLLLALVLLLRAALDPWNNIYYHLPFLFALLAYEARSGRKPLLTCMFTFILLVVVPIGGVPHMSYDLRAAVYAGVVLPTLACFAWRLWAGPARQSRVALRSRLDSSWRLPRFRQARAR